jgi:hypothetical protein
MILYSIHKELYINFYLLSCNSKRLRMFLDLNEIIHALLWKTPLIKRWQICFIVEWYDKYYTLLVTLSTVCKSTSRCITLVEHYLLLHGFSKFSILIDWQAFRKNPYPVRSPDLYLYWIEHPIEFSDSILKPEYF